MKLENCKKIEYPETRKVPINLRVTKSQSMWMKENNLSPTAIFNEALTVLGYNQKKVIDKKVKKKVIDKKVKKKVIDKKVISENEQKFNKLMGV